jgi:hypothetical protein
MEGNTSTMSFKNIVKIVGLEDSLVMLIHLNRMWSPKRKIKPLWKGQKTYC